ncbi:MAG: PhzF family phenazine biosynthesis protein [bacterium]|nr:PhzF family phenazine biosynthesis protein [bacterium]
MSNLVFYILDVFAEEKYSGNQLGVFRGASNLPDSQLQKLAKELNFSESTFIMSEEEIDGGYDVRIFTPNEEVPFAGHPTLGTAWIILHEIIGCRVEEVILNLKAGQVPVTFDYEGDFVTAKTIKQKSPTFGRTFEAKKIAEVVNLNLIDLDERFPVQEVSTGLPFILVPVRKLDSMKKASINREKYFELIKNTKAKAIFLFCPEPYDPFNDINARLFADYYGVPEDPATGSASGCLAAYIVQHRFFNQDSIDIRIEQGREIGRPSLLHVKAAKKEAGIEIFVGGKVKLIAKGEFF